MATLNDVLDMIATLSVTDRAKLNDILLGTHTSINGTLADYTEEHRFSNGRVCPHCGGTHVVRNGHRKDGKQRFVCRDCGKSFVINANAITSGTRKDLSTWQAYIDCMMNGFSVRKSADVCGICKNTAFDWRHKVLDALQGMQDSVELEGIVEADETFFPVSYKGNHKNSQTFTMPREPHHRGGEIHKRGLSDEQVCVVCAVNRNGLSYGKIGKLGKVSQKCIEVVLDKRIKSSSTLCTDKEKGYRPYAKKHELSLVQLDSGKSKKGIFHIQYINSYHSRLKDFVGRFKGVSTKYLNNYIVWNNLVVFAKETTAEKAKIFLAYVLTTLKTVHSRTLSDRPALPLLV